MQSHSEKGLGTNVSSLGRKSPTSKPCSLEDSLETLSKATPDVYTRSQPHPQGYSNPRPWCDAGEQGAGRSQHGHCRGRQDRESDRSRDPSATLGSHPHLLEEEVSGVLPHPHPSPNSSCTWQSDRPGLTFLPSAAYRGHQPGTEYPLNSSGSPRAAPCTEFTCTVVTAGELCQQRECPSDRAQVGADKVQATGGQSPAFHGALPTAPARGPILHPAPPMASSREPRCTPSQPLRLAQVAYASALLEAPSLPPPPPPSPGLLWAPFT